MYEQPAYVIADESGACRYATAAALELLGTGPAALRQLRLHDLSRPGLLRDELLVHLEASAITTDRWLTGTAELLAPDGSGRVVRFALLRRTSGELVLRLEPGRQSAGRRPGVRDVLEAWRRQEQAAAATTAGTPEHLLAEAEIDRLSAEYQLLAATRARQIASGR